jgi:hypothetical protein
MRRGILESNPSRLFRDLQYTAHLLPTFGDRARARTAATAPSPATGCNGNPAIPDPSNNSKTQNERWRIRGGSSYQCWRRTELRPRRPTIPQRPEVDGERFPPRQELIAPEDELNTFRTNPRSSPATTRLRRHSRGR